MIRARELRFVLVVDDFNAAIRLYRDVFGLDVVMDLEQDGGKGIILKIPAATLEPADVEHGGIVDELEVGRRLERPCPHRRWRWTPWRTPWWL